MDHLLSKEHYFLGTSWCLTIQTTSFCCGCVVVVVVDVDACSAATIFFNRVEIHLNQSLNLSNRRKLLFSFVCWCIVGCLGHYPLVVTHAGNTLSKPCCLVVVVVWGVV